MRVVQSTFVFCSLFLLVVLAQQNQFQILVLLQSHKLELNFSQAPSKTQIIQQLTQQFPQQNFTGISIEKWDPYYQEYIPIKDTQPIPNKTKILVQGFNGILQTNGQQNDEKILREFLLQDYDSQIWPWLEQQEVCNVTIEINFHRVLDVDMSKRTLNVMVWFTLNWFDPRLTWDPKNFNNVSRIWFEDSEFHEGEIWNPNIDLWNSEQSIGTYLFPQQYIVQNTGMVQWRRNGQFFALCDLSGLDSFPYDKSSCTLEFGSWNYDAKYVDVYSKNFQIGGMITISQDVGSIQYNIDSVKSARYIYKNLQQNNDYENGIQSQNNDWPVVLYKIILQRQHIQYTFKIIVPQGMLTFVGFGAFWLSPSCGERIGLAITVPLANAVYDLLVYEQLPQSSSIIFASAFGVACFLFSMFTVVETVFVVLLWEKNDPYFGSPLRSMRKLYMDYVDQRDWVMVIKAMDEQLSKIGTPTSKSKFQQSLQQAASIKQIQLRQSKRNLVDKEDIKNSNSESEASGETHKLEEDDILSLRTPEQVRTFFSQLMKFQVQSKNRNYLIRALQRLSRRHGMEAVETKVLQLLGVVDNDQRKVRIKNYRGEAASEYNQKWRMLSMMLDRVSQYTVVPGFIIYIVVTYVLVFHNWDQTSKDQYFT